MNDETTHIRILKEQHKTIKTASKERGITFQHLLTHIISIGIKMMKLGETK
jgi:hypothetical protein